MKRSILIATVAAGIAALAPTTVVGGGVPGP